MSAKKEMPKTPTPSYDGKTDPVAFMRIYEQTMDAMGCNDFDRIAFFMHHLKGEAYEWLLYSHDASVRKPHQHGWDKLKQAFLRYFDDVVSEEERQDLFNEIRQKEGESIVVFLRQLEQSYQEAWPTGTLSELITKAMTFMLKGVRMSICMFSPDSWATYEDFIARCRGIEHWMKVSEKETKRAAKIKHRKKGGSRK